MTPERGRWREPADDGGRALASLLAMLCQDCGTPVRRIGYTAPRAIRIDRQTRPVILTVCPVCDRAEDMNR